MSKRSHFHAYHDLKYHLVLVTKYRKKVINRPILDRLVEIIKTQSIRWDIDIIEANGESDHIHLLIKANTSVESVDLSKYINSIKTVSSRLIRKNSLSIYRSTIGSRIFGQGRTVYCQ